MRRKRYHSFHSWGVISLRNRRAFSSCMLSFGMVMFFPLSRLRRQLSQRESQVPRVMHYTERCIELSLSVRQIPICRSVRLHIIIWPDKLQERSCWKIALWKKYAQNPEPFQGQNGSKMAPGFCFCTISLCKLLSHFILQQPRSLPYKHRPLGLCAFCCLRFLPLGFGITGVAAV